MDLVEEEDLPLGETRQDRSQIPACWIAGPEEIRMGAPISAAMIIANVVLPSPGGPDSST